MNLSRYGFRQWQLIVFGASRDAQAEGKRKMIYGDLADLGRYRGMMRSLDVLIDWLSENNPAELPCGSHQILGDKVYANVMSATTRPEQDAHYETHRRYHDLQIDLEGRESFLVAEGPTVQVEPFDDANDFELVDAERGIAGNLDEGRFAIFVAGEPHMPTLEYPGDGAQPVKKICFKLIADEYFEG